MSQTLELDIRNTEISLKDAKEFVKHKLQTDKAWLVRGLMAIFARQTADEQRVEQTTDRNDIGFNSADSEILTSFAKQWGDRNWLSDKQMAILQRKMGKYAGQLVRIARGLA